MPSGSGRSFGAAVIDCARNAGQIRHSRAVHWHAKLRLLTKSAPGYAAMRAAGIDVTARTLVTWLSWGGDGDPEPSKANKARIDKAWGIYGVGFAISRGTGAITGLVQFGYDDLRERGRPPYAPLKIRHWVGTWANLGPELAKTSPDPVLVEALYISDVIIPDLGEPSGGIEFPGDDYILDVY